MNDNIFKIQLGLRGERGIPSFIPIPLSVNSLNTTSYIEAGSVILVGGSSSTFNSMALGVYVESGATGSVIVTCIDSLGSSTTIYENTNISSTNANNIEVVTSYLSLPFSTVSTLARLIISFKSNVVGKTIALKGCSLFNYN